MSGDPRDGVHRHARALVAHCPGATLRRVVDRCDTGAGSQVPAGDADWSVLVYVDRWYPDTFVVLDWISAQRRADRRVAVILHDVPQAAEGVARAARRRERYEPVVAAADVAVVSNRHEADMVVTWGVGPVEVAAHYVLPLRTIRTPHGVARNASSGTADGPPTIAVAGHLHPGKGVDVLLDELVGVDPSAELVVLGAAAAGHEAEAAALLDTATGLGRAMRITGWLDDDAYVAALAGATVPVAAHRHLSASGSIADWIGAGRRPIVPDHPVTRELERSLPGVLRRVRSGDELAVAVAEHLAEPAATHHGVDVSRHGPAMTAAAVLDVLAGGVSR